MRHTYLFLIFFVSEIISPVPACFSSGNHKQEENELTEEPIAQGVISSGLINEEAKRSLLMTQREMEPILENDVISSKTILSNAAPQSTEETMEKKLNDAKEKFRKSNKIKANEIETMTNETEPGVHLESVTETNKENVIEMADGLNEETFRLNSKFVEVYLKEFGYLKEKKNDKKISDEAHLIEAVKKFQDFMGIKPASGRMNIQTTKQMLQKRCSSMDVHSAEDIHPIWDYSTLRYYLVTPRNTKNWLPEDLSMSDWRELIRQAFSAWEIVISIDFIEEFDNEANADIIFEFGERKNDSLELSGLGVASSTVARKSRIWIEKHEKWSTFQVQEEDKLDIFLVLIHEIGHILGLQHSMEKNSVMYPIFEREVGEQLPVVSAEDVERLRMLYDPDEINIDESSLPNEFLPSQPLKCPNSLWAITQRSPNSDIFVFMNVQCWRFSANHTLIEGPKPIAEIFPNAPPYVDVAISLKNLTVLIQERTLYGYVVDSVSGKMNSIGIAKMLTVIEHEIYTMGLQFWINFRTASGYPRPLHGRVLFYPEAAFPLSNGSVILLRDNVFATYNLYTNEPTMLNDKNLFFPNLPTDIRAGLPVGSVVNGTNTQRNDNLYLMFGIEEVTLFDFEKMKGLRTQSLSEFLKCNENTYGFIEETQKIRPKLLNRVSKN